MRKAIRSILCQLESVKTLSADEKVLFARSLSATPD